LRETIIVTSRSARAAIAEKIGKFNITAHLAEAKLFLRQRMRTISHQLGDFFRIQKIGVWIC